MYAGKENSYHATKKYEHKTASIIPTIIIYVCAYICNWQ